MKLYNQKLITTFLILFLFVNKIFTISVEIEQVLNSPSTKWGNFFDDSAAYASNGKLIFMSRLALNVFVLNNGNWERLIMEYKTESYNYLEEQKYLRADNSIYDSIIPGEFLYKIEKPQTPAEYYRIYINPNNVFRSVCVNRNYFESNNAQYLSRGWSINEGTILKRGFKVELTQVPDTGEGYQYWPDIVDSEGNLVYRITQDLNLGFVEDIMTITTNPEKTRVAMVVSFKPEKSSPYYLSNYRFQKKLVIFKIDYDS